ncbi:unnamed protein product [Prunus armeniaca]
MCDTFGKRIQIKPKNSQKWAHQPLTHRSKPCTEIQVGAINKLLFGVFSIALILIHVSQARPNKEPHQDLIDEHNRARAEVGVGVGSIKWNDTVAAYAQKYADSKIETCEMVQSQGPYGENLAEGYGEMTGGQAVKFWPKGWVWFGLIWSDPVL